MLRCVHPTTDARRELRLDGSLDQGSKCGTNFFVGRPSLTPAVPFPKNGNLCPVISSPVLDNTLQRTQGRKHIGSMRMVEHMTRVSQF